MTDHGQHGWEVGDTIGRGPGEVAWVAYGPDDCTVVAAAYIGGEIVHADLGDFWVHQGKSRPRTRRPVTESERQWLTRCYPGDIGILASQDGLVGTRQAPCATCGHVEPRPLSAQPGPLTLAYVVAEIDARTGGALRYWKKRRAPAAGVRSWRDAVTGVRSSPGGRAAYVATVADLVITGVLTPAAGATILDDLG